MKTKMYLLKNGKKSFAAEFSGKNVFDFYVSECKKKGVNHTICCGVLNIADKIVFELA